MIRPPIVDLCIEKFITEALRESVATKGDISAIKVDILRLESAIAELKADIARLETKLTIRVGAP